MNRIKALTLVLGLAVASPSFAASITGVVVGNPDFSTLKAAVIAAGLDGTLDTGGPFTVFAPTNDAFDKLPPKVLGKLLEPGNVDLLTELLLFHVVDGTVPAATVVTLNSATTLQGDDVQINTSGGKVRVEQAVVTQTDVQADNGIIHIVDSVLLPQSFIGRLNRR